MARFRFHGLEIWQMAIELGDRLFDKEQDDFLDAFELLSKRITSFKKNIANRGLKVEGGEHGA